jgi:hypothetical protein
VAVVTIRSAPLNSRRWLPLVFAKSNCLVKELPQVKVVLGPVSAPEIRRSPVCVVVRLFEVREVPPVALELAVATTSSGEVPAMPLYS